MKKRASTAGGSCRTRTKQKEKKLDWSCSCVTLAAPTYTEWCRLASRIDGMTTHTFGYQRSAHIFVRTRHKVICTVYRIDRILFQGSRGRGLGREKPQHTANHHTNDETNTYIVDVTSFISKYASTGCTVRYITSNLFNCRFLSYENECNSYDDRCMSPLLSY